MGGGKEEIGAAAAATLWINGKLSTVIIIFLSLFSAVSWFIHIYIF